MEAKEKNKTGLRAFWALAPRAHTALLIALGLIGLHLAARGDRELMAQLSQAYIRPLHYKLALLWDKLPGLAAAELMIWAAIAIALGATGMTLYRVLTRPQKLRRLYALILGLLASVAGIYAGYSLLWGSYYYGDSFIDTAGFESREIELWELQAVTEYFAGLANYYGALVPRDSEGLYLLDKQELISQSGSLYDQAQALHPSLSGPRVRVKGIVNSRLLSYLDFTGFFFPFTGEACVNTDFPSGLFPATVAHELAHQRGVAREQDANFVAVLSSLESGQLDYCYSAALLAYTHLGNALYEASYEQWEEVYLSLEDGPLKDLSAGNAYWRQLDGPVQAVSNTVHEGLLQSYDQQLGRRSYGACVDLLVCYYLDAALEDAG